ncbi:MAG: cysteine dioxygenase [Polaribacter sp.]
MNSKENSTTTLQNLNDLITALAEGERTTYNHIIHSLKLKATAFEKYAFWSNECYTRNCIADTEKFELILICWCEGHRTAIHDHGGEECWVKVIEGEFSETIYKKDEAGGLNLVKSTISKKDDITYMKDFMGFHRLENIAKKRSMSLHLYAKPIRNCNVFNETSKRFVNKELDYDTNA